MTLVKSDRHQVLKRIGRRHLHKWFFLFFFALLPDPRGGRQVCRPVEGEALGV